MKSKVMLLAVLLPLLSAVAGVKKATICTTYGDDIYDYQLDQYIDSVVPPSARRLIILTQCYGGDCLDNFAGGTNTAVISATSAGQKAHYGGYDDDAANACRPGAGRTGQNVHDEGVAGKESSETPATGGGLAPGAVSLEPVTADGAVRSRHVVVYAGMPDKKGRDDAQRDKIKSNFKGQLNTTVTTVGGEGSKDGWDKKGSAKGLKEAINEAAAAIQAAPDPSKEQFLLFVTDHGDLHTVEHVVTPAPPSNKVVVANVAAFVAADFEERQFDRPGFSFTVDIAPFTHEVGDPANYTPFFPTNAWRLLLTPPPPAAPLLLTGFEERFIEVEDGIIGNAPEEGVRVFFPVEPTVFVDSFFDVFYDVEIFNDTPDPFMIMEFSQDTGPVAKDDSEPGFFLITENTLIGENDMLFDGHDIIVDGCTLTVDGVHVFNGLTLNDNAIVTHSVGSMGMVLTALENATIPAGSKVDANAKGMLPLPDSTGRSGGSYGGRGGDYMGVSGQTYGDALRPVDSGSGGTSGAPTRGGGRIQLTAGELLLNGTFCANGGNGGSDYTSGGSGGAILIKAGILTGNGVVQANGGDPFSTGSQGGGAGGGGRIALYYDDDSAFTPQTLEAGGGYNNVAGGAGTIYLERKGTPGLLRLDNRGHLTSPAIPTPVACHVNAFDRLEVLRSARLDLTVTQALAFASLTVSNATMTFTGSLEGPELDLALVGNSVLTHKTGDLNGLRINAKSVVIGTGAAIDAGSKGMGPLPATEGRSGGSYGGRGANSFGSSAPTYGNAYWPTDLGSGGVGDGTSRGGGRIEIMADELSLDGELRANGQDGFNYMGGGSGGSILLDVSVLSGSGTIRANGGSDGSYGGGAGGGGRVAVYAQNAEGFTPSALEAKAVAGAEWGTVFMGVPRTVAVTCTGQGICNPPGPVVIPYGGMEPFVFNPMPLTLVTNGTAATPVDILEWSNTGLWRGTLADAAWLARISGGDTIEAGFEPLAAGPVNLPPGGGMAVTVNALAGWRYTLERRFSLTEGDWEPVPGQTEILCVETGALLLQDDTAFPQAFYRVIAMP